MEWKSLKECYRACLPLNLPAEAGLIYRSSNNMCPQFPGSPFFSTRGNTSSHSSYAPPQRPHGVDSCGAA